MKVQRFNGNPIIKPGNVKPSRDDYKVICAFNPGAIRFDDEILLLLRVAEVPADKEPDEQVAPIYDARTGRVELFRVKDDDPNVEIPDSRSFRYKGKVFLTSISHLRIARSKDGRKFKIDEKPAMFPATDYESFGLEDPRITRMGDDYYITYKAVSANAICTALARTRDFRNFERLGVIFCCENLDVVLFPEKIGGKFYALHRPVPRYIGSPTIWLADSEDGIYWGGHKQVIPPRAGFFDSAKTGGSCVPIRTDRGWLEIYHGSDEQDKYALGGCILDINDPGKVVARSQEPIMVPEADYEVKGFYGNVVFSCGAIDHEDGRVDIYYGAADEYTAAASTTIDDIFSTMNF